MKGFRIMLKLSLLLILTSCGFERSADMAWMGARDAVNRAYTYSETELENCFQKNGCSIRGPEGSAGPVGANGRDGQNGTNGLDGTNGTNGTDGTNGTNGTNGKDGAQGPKGEGCTVAGATGGVLVMCGETAEFISHGQDGLDGTNGIDGTDGIVEIVDPCGDNPGEFDEVLIKTINNEWLAYFEQGNRRFLSILPPGNYQTTDKQQCFFTITLDMEVVY